VGSSAKNVHTK